MSQKEEIAATLLQIDAVMLRPHEPFTWASGIKSPIYTDNRLTISYPKIRRMIAEGFASLIRERFPEANLIAGAATGGIPHAAWVADLLQLPMVYVRSKAKDHGRGSRIEGRIEGGEKAVVIEDLISTGESSLQVVRALREEKVEVLGVTAIFTYQFPLAERNFKKEDVSFFTLTDFHTLIAEAKKRGTLSEEELHLVQEWHRQFV
ncbi:MAG: orotate phosphoribosyltransferase [Thermicanus sp.]|nr:orotate phosphoribosyltransferase [Thermicanus sp.]